MWKIHSLFLISEVVIILATPNDNVQLFKRLKSDCSRCMSTLLGLVVCLIKPMKDLADALGVLLVKFANDTKLGKNASRDECTYFAEKILKSKFCRLVANGCGCGRLLESCSGQLLFL